MRVRLGHLGGLGICILFGLPAWAGGTGQIRVEVQNMPAEIVLDGFLTGKKAPALLENVAPGEHEVQLEYGCLLGTAVVSVKAESTTRARLRVKNRGGKGTVRVRDLPPWGEVFVDGRPIEEAGKGVEVSCGERVVSVEASGVEPWSTRVVVNTGQWSTVAVPQDWVGMEGDLGLVIRNDESRRVRSGFEQGNESSVDEEFDDWEDVDAGSRHQDAVAREAREKAARQAREREERAEQQRLAAEVKKHKDKLEQLKLAREASLSSLRDAEGRLAEVDALIADEREALKAVGGVADGWTDAAPDEDQGDGRVSDQESGSRRGRQGAEELDLKPAKAEVDRGQMRIERQRRRQEEAQAERRAEEERARLQQRIVDGRSKGDEIDDLDILDEPYGMDTRRPGRPAGMSRKGFTLSKKPIAVASGVVGLGGLGLGLAGFGSWKKGEETWENMLTYCEDDSTEDLEGLARGDVCPYTEDPLVILSDHAKETLQKVSQGKTRALIGVTIALAGGAGATASWLYLDVGTQSTTLGIEGRW